MTFKEFNHRLFKISQQKFESHHTHPLDHGIGRSRFEEQRLKQMIALAERVEGCTARRRLEMWQRKLKRTIAARERMQRMKAGNFEGLAPFHAGQPLPAINQFAVRNSAATAKPADPLQRSNR